MPIAYSTYDTLSLELSETGPDGPDAYTLPVLAKIPRIELAKTAGEAPQDQAKVDTAHPTASSPKSSVASLASTVFEVRADSARAISLGDAAPRVTVAPTTENPAVAPAVVTRIDTPIVVEPEKSESPNNHTDEAVLPFDEPEGLIGLLLRAESLVAPYSQMIVLLTLLIATALAVLLLRGQPAAIDDRLQSLTPATDAVAQAPPITSDTTLQPADQSDPTPQVAARVRGPIGVRSTTNLQGQITGVAPLEPYRETSEVRFAQRPLPKPSMPSDPSVISERPNVPRLSHNIQPSQEPATR